MAAAVTVGLYSDNNNVMLLFLGRLGFYLKADFHVLVQL